MIKKMHLTIVLFLLTCFTIQGQNFLKEFGKIGKDEIELKQYSQDKDAEALVLFDIAKSYFVRKESSFDIVFERTTRIKVLSEAGIKWAEVEIPFYQEGGIYEKVYDIEAYSYNYENGLIDKTPLNISNTFNEKINNYWNVKKFAVPGVKEGTIIEYRYKINSQYKFNLRDWEFQWKIPVVYSEYEVKMIPFYEYSFLLQGATKFDSQTSYVDKQSSHQFGSITFQDMVHKYIMKDIPAFNNEEFITSINDYIIKIDFQLSKINYPNGSIVDIITTWEDMNKELLKHNDFGKYARKSEKLASKLFKAKNLALNDDREKFENVMEYVKGNYNWDKSNGKYASKTPKKFVEEKYGNSADINLFTIGLLNASGIAAKPVLISTRENGKIKYDYPYTHFFNYVIILANVDGDNILTDATEILGLNNRIPSKCINDKGLIIQEDRIEWIGLECAFPSEIVTDMQIEITNDAIINSRITKNATEYDASYYRNIYTDNTETIKKRLETTDYFIIDSSITVHNQLNKEKPYILNYKQTSKLEIVNEKYYLSPFLNETISDNPLKQNERTYPIDMTYPRQRIYNSTILIPEGYKVEYIPSAQKIKNQLFESTYSTRFDDNQLIISFDYYFKKSVYSASDYSKIKFYFNEIVKKGNEKVVLSKSMTENNKAQNTL
jgi:hypothetical protein